MKSKKRGYVWAHNGKCGSLARSINFIKSIQGCPSFTPEAEAHVVEALKHLEIAKANAQRFRVEPDGSLSVIKSKG